jgi:hypothetical protein
MTLRGVIFDVVLPSAVYGYPALQLHEDPTPQQDTARIGMASTGRTGLDVIALWGRELQKDVGFPKAMAPLA